MGLNNIASIFNRKERKAFSKLKELYGYELVQNNKLQTSKPLSKEQKRITKEKIKNQYKNQVIKNILSFIIALIIFILTAYIIVFFLNKGINVY
ncbi:MAG: hypothetical protein K8R54_13575 [Bacteroidales bacterium]|nr:hypothetical protein [Bacteroidales bacterium]